MAKARTAGKFPMNGCLDKVAINRTEDPLDGDQNIQFRDSHNLEPVGTLTDTGITILEQEAEDVWNQ